ncbi:MAG TPA: hypothetical protein VF989_17160 [Polyangiaceae bacterium]|jgi:hypothetical protein
MHESERAEYATCAACGGEVSTMERTYLFGNEEVLCFRCAVARNGIYDEPHDHWTVAPNVDDLLRETAGEA